MATSAPKTIGSRDAIQQARANIVAFLIVQAGLGSIFYVLLARQGSASSTGDVLTPGLMWCPALAAGLASRFRHIPGPRIRNIGRPGYLAVGYVIPVLCSQCGIAEPLGLLDKVARAIEYSRRVTFSISGTSDRLIETSSDGGAHDTYRAQTGTDSRISNSRRPAGTPRPSGVRSRREVRVGHLPATELGGIVDGSAAAR